MRPARLAGACAALVVALVFARAGATRAAAPANLNGLASTRTLVTRLGAAGRGVANVTLTRTDPMGGPPVSTRGRLALEPPDRMRLDFPSSGERIAARRDGGEWIQPSAHQMVKLKPEQTELAAGLWQVFLRGGAGRFTERAAGARHYVLAARASEEPLPGEIHLKLDARGLPASLEMDDPSSGHVRYTFSAWRFSRPSGAAAFRLRAPKGYAVVDLP